MRKAVWLVSLLVLALFALPAFAQDATAEVTPEATTETSVVEATPAADDGTDVQTAHIRVAHFSPDAGDVQVFIDGEPSDIQLLSFPDVTGWVELPVGTYEVAVGPVSGTIDDVVIGPVSLSFAPNAWITIAAVGSAADGTLTAQLIPEDISAIDAGNARVTIYHAIENAPAVDVLSGDTIVVQGLEFSGTYTLDLPADTYDLQVVASGTQDVILDLSGTEIAANTFYLVAAIGTPDAPEVFLEAIELNVLSDFLDGATGSIVEVAQADGRFTTLLTALDAAGLTETLSGEGEFTVFAPTDDAFAAVPADALSALLADPDALADVLLYHVADGILTSDDVLASTSITTLQGGTVAVSQNADGVFLNGNAEVIILDIPATNGVIHVISAVLMPMADADMDMEATAEATPAS